MDTIDVNLFPASAQINAEVQEVGLALAVDILGAGPPGKTPVKGVDYWTTADREQLVAETLAALPMYSGEVEDVVGD